MTVKSVRGAAAAVEERGIAGNCCTGDKQHVGSFNHGQIAVQQVDEQVMIIPDVLVVIEVI